METNCVLIERQMVRQQLFTLYCVGGQDTEFVTGSTVFLVSGILLPLF